MPTEITATDSCDLEHLLPAPLHTENERLNIKGR